MAAVPVRSTPPTGQVVLATATETVGSRLGGGCDGNSVVEEPWAGVADISGGDDDAVGGGVLAPAVGTDVVDDCDMVGIMDGGLVVVDDDDELVVAAAGARWWMMK